MNRTLKLVARIASATLLAASFFATSSAAVTAPTEIASGVQEKTPLTNEAASREFADYVERSLGVIQRYMLEVRANVATIKQHEASMTSAYLQANAAATKDQAFKLQKDLAELPYRANLSAAQSARFVAVQQALNIFTTSITTVIIDLTTGVETGKSTRADAARDTVTMTANRAQLDNTILAGYKYFGYSVEQIDPGTLQPKVPIP